MNQHGGNATHDGLSAMPKFEHFRTCETQEAQLWGSQVFCQNELLRIDARSPMDANMSYRQFGDLGIGQISYGAEVTISPNQFDTFYLVQMLLHGGECIDNSGQITYASQSVGCVLNAQRAIRIRHGSKTKKLILKVGRDLLERQCGQHLGRGMQGQIEFDTAMPLDSPAGKRWMRTMYWLIDFLNDDEASSSPLLRAQIEQMIVAMLLECQHSNQSDAFVDDSHNITPSFVRRAEQFLDEHAYQPITVCDIAEHIGVSTRSLHSGFRKYRNTSPMVMLKEIRLKRVREQLMQSEIDQTTVTMVAYQWGFCHLGHFSTDYKRRFGETPSETLAR